MKKADLDCLLRNLAQGNKEEVINVVRRAAAEEQRKNPNSSWGITLEGYVGKIERRAPYDPKILTMLNPSGKTQASMAAFEERVPIRELGEIILTAKTKLKVENLLASHTHREKLAEHGLQPQCRVLVTGKPGTGKTMLAEIIAKETKKPFYILKMGKLMDSLLGNTIRNIENSFAAIAATDGVFLFDEFDSLTTARNDRSDVNEMRRAINSLLQCFEQHQGPSIVIATTNRADTMDSAFRRRFDSVWELAEPDETGRLRIIQVTLEKHRMPQTQKIVAGLSTAMAAFSYDECEDTIRKLITDAIIAGETAIHPDSVEETARFTIGN